MSGHIPVATGCSRRDPNDSSVLGPNLRVSAHARRKADAFYVVLLVDRNRWASFFVLFQSNVISGTNRLARNREDLEPLTGTGWDMLGKKIFIRGTGGSAYRAGTWPASWNFWFGGLRSRRYP